MDLFLEHEREAAQILDALPINYPLASQQWGMDLVMENIELRQSFCDRRSRSEKSDNQPRRRGAAPAGQTIAAPSGCTVKLDGKSPHLCKPVMIGRISKDGAHPAGIGNRSWCHRRPGAGGARCSSRLKCSRPSLSRLQERSRGKMTAPLSARQRPWNPSKNA
jgi:hypothetical protein